MIVSHDAMAAFAPDVAFSVGSFVVVQESFGCGHENLYQ